MILKVYNVFWKLINLFIEKFCNADTNNFIISWKPEIYGLSFLV